MYEGDWIANKRHGFGVLMKKVNGYFVFVYEGQWINNRIVSVHMSVKNIALGIDSRLPKFTKKYS